MLPEPRTVITISIGGDLAPGNRASLRTISTIALNLQLAFNRVYLDIKHGGVKKHSRVKHEHYPDSDFLFQSTREGSWIVDFISSTEWGEKIANRFSEILEPAFELLARGVDREIYNQKEALENAKTLIRTQRKIADFPSVLANPPRGFSTSYVEKSMLRFVSSSLSPVRNPKFDNGTIGFEIKTPQQAKTYPFNKNKSLSLKNLVSRTSYLSPAIYNGKIISTHSERLVGIFKNKDNHDTEQRLIINSNEDFITINNIYNRGGDIIFYGMPRVEAGSLDLSGGDVLFVEVKND
jgi:hypothetical protein